MRPSFFEFAAKCHSNGVLNSRINGTGTCKILNLVHGDGKAVAEKLLLLLLLFVISFMQGIYTYVPEIIHVCSSVAAVLYSLFMVHITLLPLLNLLYFYISTFRSMCGLPSMAAFCSSLISCCPGLLLLGYFLNNFEIVIQGGSNMTGTTCV